jgi:hypothetical protein
VSVCHIYIQPLVVFKTYILPVVVYTEVAQVGCDRVSLREVNRGMPATYITLPFFETI